MSKAWHSQAGQRATQSDTSLSHELPLLCLVAVVVTPAFGDGGGGRLSDMVGGANGVGSGGKVAAVRVGEGLE